jgi:hypothetical protein
MCHTGAIDDAPMTRRSFAYELEEAANRISDISRANLQIILRRAALRLRNVEGLTLDAKVDQAIDELAADMKLPRSEVLRTIVRDWLTSAGRLRADAVDEESETDGNA